MRRPWLASLVLGLAGCGGATDVTTDNLAGLWTATVFEYSATGGAGTQVDLVADSAMVISMAFDTDLSGQATFLNGGSNNSSSFTWALDGSSIVMWEDTFAAELRDSETTLVLEGLTTHDFDGDGTEEAALLQAELVRVE